MDPPSGDQERKSAAPPALDNPRALGEKKAPEKDQENPRDPSLELTDEDVSSSEDEPIRDEDLDILHSRFSVNSLSLRDLLKEQQKELEARKASGRRKKRGPTVPSSAFMYYRLDELDNVASNHPEATAEEVIKLVEDKWLRLDPEIRAIYQDKASKDRERYLEERRAYLPKSAGGLMKRHKKRKHPNAPKHPKSAYLFFTEDYRERVKKSNSGLTFHQIAKILGEKWANLGAEEKTIYEMKSMEDKERYAREKAAFEEPPIETPQDDLDQKRKQRDVLMAMAPRHPLSSYVIFVSMNRNRISKLFPDRTFLETARLLGVVWRSMSREMKRKYMILAASDRLRFEEEKAEWDPPSILVGDAMNGPINNVGKENVVPSRPRKPTSAYAIWAAEERAAVLQEYPEIDRRELTKILRQNWKELTELERMPYEEQASRENAELEEILAKEKAEQEQQAAIPVNVPQNTRGASERDVFFHFGSPDASNRMGPVHNSGNFASMPPALESSKHNSIGIPTFASLPPAQTTLEPQTPIEEWNAAQIGQFIESLGLFQYSGAFAKSDLTGNTFVQLSTIDLKNTYGITSLGDRKKIRAAIDQKLTESI